ncbi:MAG: transposase [candidate division KSB1 bacterium]|nr:transposase [candidate division KSB1 bacterium]MDZ7367239.1 transposase [candidate division KSB1 bacterium]
MEKKNWVVDCRPVGSGERALKYLAPYIFRVAISNRRLLKLETCPGRNGNVTFQYRDGDIKQFKARTVAAEEFTP